MKRNSTPAPAAAPGYRARAGITTDDARYEPGDLVPAAVVAAAPWLLERGVVEPLTGAPAPATKQEGPAE